MVRLVVTTLVLSAAVFLGLLILGAGPGPGFGVRGLNSAGDAPELIAQVVTAQDLRNAYAIESRGDAAFGNRLVEVTGLCLGVRQDRDGVPFVMLARPGQERVCVVGRLDEFANAQLLAETAGTEIAIRGRCVGRKGRSAVLEAPAAVHLEECSLVRGP
jgi:hypothetical protein